MRVTLKSVAFVASYYLVTCVLTPPAVGMHARSMDFANHIRTCRISDAAPTTTAPKMNVWAALTSGEVAAVWEFVHNPRAGLNLTDPEEATLTDNYVYFIDTLHTNKSDVLPYLEGRGSLPAKYARVVVFEGGKDVPVSQEYMVGPLPVSVHTKLEKLDYIFNGGKGGTVPFNARYFDNKRSAASEPLLVSIMTNISDITVALSGFVYYGSSDERTNVTSTSTTPSSFDGSSAYRRILFRYPGSASYMIPLDFFVMLDISGTDASKYFLKGFVTNSRFFPDIASLREAFDAGELKEEFKQTRDQEWAEVKYQPSMGVRDLDDRLAPQSIELGGKRYKLDLEQQYIEFMGWSFYMAFTRTLGLMFYDIKFKGERILYELSMQEATAQYAGRTPKASGTLYQDSHYGFGTYSATLVPGFDCPYGSTLLNVSFPEGNATEVHPDAICIFEADSGFPLARHRASGSNEWGFDNLGTVKGSALHARTVATVGNYDYLFSYAFHVDGWR